VSDPRWLTFDLFEPRVGEQFVVGADGLPTVAMELVEATEGTEPGGTGPDGQQRLQFTLLFAGPLDQSLPQSTYTVEHDVLGRLDLFLVPVGPDGGAMRYAASFS
jgi:hypothetical protein